jgi:hypothetical protein
MNCQHCPNADALDCGVTCMVHCLREGVVRAWRAALVSLAQLG